MNLNVCGAGLIVDLAERLAKRHIKRLCVEAGHIYMDETPNGQHHMGLKLGSEFCRILSEHVPCVTKMLFVDDYNPSEKTLDMEGYQEIARQMGFSPDLLVWESSLCAPATELVDGLVETGHTHLDDNGNIHTNQQNIRLRYQSGKIACAMLDVALYRKKLESHDFSITILPTNSSCEYHKQQRNVRRLLRILGMQSIPLANVYFGLDGSFSIGLSD